MGDGLMTSKETFKEYPVNSKLDTLFDFAVATYEKQEKMDDRIEKLEKRKWYDKGIAAGSGFASGLLALVAAVKLKLF